MPVVAIIPVKSFALGKQRLADTLSPEARTRLGQGLASHVASTAAAAGLVPLIVTAEADVAEWATRGGFPSIADPGDGLNAAARSGVDWATAARSDWVVVHSDLPMVSAHDLTALTDELTEGADVIAPSADGGTSAIGSHSPIAFAFGIASFHHHLPRLDNPSVVTRPGLLLDVDSPADLEAAATSRHSAWIRDVIEDSGVPATSRNLY